MSDNTAAANKLLYKDRFESILQSYSPTKDNIDILEASHPIFLIGPTAAGRNTLINILIETNRYHYIISDTTRKPRYNKGILEQNGVEYWFKTEDEFMEGLKAGSYIEAAIIHGQQVSGMSMNEVIKAREANKRVISEIDIVGASTVDGYINTALFIFLLPPSFDVWMERLTRRGNMPELELKRRLESAVREFKTALAEKYYHFVVNNDIHLAANVVDELANGRPPSEVAQSKGRAQAKELVANIEQYLKRK